ncbi:MAG TPA: hypothetical protein VMU02_05160 [bacterium]|nr:hypothetical protein [bacterium]
MSTPRSHVKLSITLALVALAGLSVGLGAPRCEVPEAAAIRDSTEMPETWVHPLRSLPCTEPETGSRFAPLGLAFDIKGDLYVVDADHSELLVAHDSSLALSFFAGCPSTDAGCRFVDVASYGGSFYLSDRAAGLVIELDSKGAPIGSREVGSGIGGLDVGPSGLLYGAMTLQGSIVIADIYSDKSPITSSVAGTTSGSYPVDCLVQNRGRILVTDAFAKQVIVLGPLGSLAGYLQGFDFKSPFGLCTCLDRYVLVSDSELGCVAVFNLAGRFLGTFGRARLQTPTFLAARDDGTVCVADVGKLTIEEFRLDDLSHQ